MEPLEDRTLKFALRAIDVVDRIPRGRAGDVVSTQFLESATSVGANWREAQGAASSNDFNYKVGICERESRESHYWLQIIFARLLRKDTEVVALGTEANELVSIFTSIGRKTSKKRTPKKPKQDP